MSALLEWQKELEAEQRIAKKSLREHSRWATRYLIPLFGPDSKDAAKMSTAAIQQGFHRDRYQDVEWRRKVLNKINQIRAQRSRKD